MLRSPHHSSFT